MEKKSNEESSIPPRGGYLTDVNTLCKNKFSSDVVMARLTVLREGDSML